MSKILPLSIALALCISHGTALPFFIFNNGHYPVALDAYASARGKDQLLFSGTMKPHEIMYIPITIPVNNNYPLLTVDYNGWGSYDTSTKSWSHSNVIWTHPMPDNINEQTMLEISDTQAPDRLLATVMSIKRSLTISSELRTLLQSITGNQPKRGVYYNPYSIS